MALISLEEFKKAIDALEEALDLLKDQKESKLYKITRDACIQRFEFCVELSWKLASKKLASSSTTARPVIREMAQNALIADPKLWFDFIEARNKSSHTYDEKIAEEVLISCKEFPAHGYALLERLKIA